MFKDTAEQTATFIDTTDKLFDSVVDLGGQEAVAPPSMTPQGIQRNGWIDTKHNKFTNS